ncbi:hypothetical protein DACRYDRAFT_106239 [Dacryopinax primogenitus]|uniref:Uncharacterized protein n=1 Tax=Dacryopinax primogenitus (strain DJM 731) TaxID=1858805 RepID=M5FYD3_DACPD|nr:uncharacterized protein DACRYDRAFT_106239 [Dacryopinax primogenitus]EJU03061.1 hypothetical protein DACRYDRAFT_106239 [Dacryopinax primogenitus]
MTDVHTSTSSLRKTPKRKHAAAADEYTVPTTQEPSFTPSAKRHRSMPDSVETRRGNDVRTDAGTTDPQESDVLAPETPQSELEGNAVPMKAGLSQEF